MLSTQDLITVVTEAHPGQDLQHHETHISHVLLVGDVAYKIKKHVDLGFCDFTSLERRRHFCHEELRLNRRLAKDFYLDVRAFCRNKQGGVHLSPTRDDPGAAADEAVVEYAVRMRRFPQGQLLSQLAERDALKREWFDDLAQTLANFHHHASRAKLDDIAGTPSQVWKPVEECLNSLELTEEQRLTSRLSTQLPIWCKSEFHRLNDWFRSRKGDGHIRECHGDLHLGNMFLNDGKIVVFDCIEFNDALRWIDTASDLAFAVMDLKDRGAAYLGHRLLNEYLQATNDYDALQGLNFYLVYRALVRAKVAALRCGQTEPHTAEHSDAASELFNYFELALQLTKRDKPWLAITHGLSGSGKSTVAKQLVEELGAIRIRSDVIRRKQFGTDSERYNPAATEWTYTRLAELAEQIISAGYPVVVDATFLLQQERIAFKHLAERLNSPFVIVACSSEMDTLRQRIASRSAQGNDPSEATAEVLEMQARAVQPLSAEERRVAINAQEPGVNAPSFTSRFRAKLQGAASPPPSQA